MPDAGLPVARRAMPVCRRRYKRRRFFKMLLPLQPAEAEEADEAIKDAPDGLFARCQTEGSTPKRRPLLR